ncbi:MAG: HEAT repeat domain-containing protein [Planctomycetes bacterium]|nr:HEAT repeat domain-containing protein [Planctomycetota bacterium]
MPPLAHARLLRVLSVAFLAVWVGALRPAGAEESPTERMKPGHCSCQEGEACWHYLRSPLRPPEDPCRCGFCASGGNCSSKDRPDGWGAECTGSQKPECFWKRHAASWGITCSRCAEDTECTSCDGLPGFPDADAKAKLAHQLDVESAVGLRKADPAARKKMAVAWTSRFYVATDIPQLKVLTQGGAPRVMDTHEIAHLFLERAEKAYDDFVEVFGDDARLGQPMAIYLASRTSKKEAWQATYFGSPRTNMLYGGGGGKVAGGFCWNGFATSTDDYGSDRDLHGYVRHMVGHILFSCWHGVTGQTKNCPKWAFVACADWLCKIHPFFADWTTFCHDESTGASGSGKDWDKKAVAIAAGKRPPTEKLFGHASLSHLSYDDHVRAWSYMKTMLDEDRDRWLATLKLLREGKEHAAAFREGLGMTPDDFDARWADRMLGKRKSMAETPKDVALTGETGGVDAAERRRIQAEQDPITLAALLRGLEKVRSVETARLVLSRLAIDADVVRETIVLLLKRTEDPEVIGWLRTSGLSDADAMVRAHVARVLGDLKDTTSRTTFEAMLKDPHWLVRANAAKALQDLADPASAPVLVAEIEDKNPKAWIAKADACAALGQATSKATKAVVARLTASDWQVRLSACRALATMGDIDAVDPLIERLDTEGGRLHREIHAALKAVTHESFGPNPQVWRKWWQDQKPKGIPPPLPEAKNPEDDRYAPAKKPGEDEPTYYGRRIFSQSVLFVLDVSKSMETLIEVPKDAQEKLGTLPKGQRIDVAKNAVITALGKLDARTRFNLVFFSTKVRPWQDALVVAGGMGAQAIGAVKAAGLEEETNIYGALKAAVGLHEKPTLQAQLDPIPDTMYFLTDGTPTRGEITDTETILSWMRDVNRFAKVEIHVIAMGNTGVDLEFLRRLAAENDGEFIHVPDRK